MKTHGCEFKIWQNTDNDDGVAMIFIPQFSQELLNYYESNYVNFDDTFGVSSSSGFELTVVRIATSCTSIGVIYSLTNSKNEAYFSHLLNIVLTMAPTVKFVSADGALALISALKKYNQIHPNNTLAFRYCAFHVLHNTCDQSIFSSLNV